MAAQNGLIVTGVDVNEQAASRVVLSQKRGSEAQAALAVRTCVLVHASDQLWKGSGSRGQGLEACLKGRHQHGGRNTFAGDIGDGENHAILLGCLSRPREDIVVIAGDGVRWARGVGNREAWDLRRGAGQQPGLDLTRNLQIALHDYAVGYLKHQKKKQKQPSPELGVKLDAMKTAKGVLVAEVIPGTHQHDQRQQQQYAARGRKFFEDGPKEFLEDMEAAAASG